MTFALTDGNCFFASCERVFRPSLKGKPLIILSNNDGNAIARTDEAKALGIKMGDPWFQIKHLVDSHGLVAMSANFALYGDLSSRMMEVIERYSPKISIYSIDEAFSDFSNLTFDLTEYAQRIRKDVMREVGIPTCIGLGPTHVLAKLANHVAKKRPEWNGVCDLTQLSRFELAALMKEIEVGEVWGIGRRISKRLNEIGIHSVFDLAKMKPEAARAEFSIVTGKIVQELRGISRIELEEIPNPKKQIMASRSFGFPITELSQLEQALAEFIASACKRLRTQNSLAGGMQIFIRTSPFDKGKQYYNSCMVSPPYPTSDSLKFTKYALRALQSIYRPGVRYKKAGVMLVDISAGQNVQGELFQLEEENVRRAHLMETMDLLNQRFGRGSVKTGSIGFHDKDNWYVRQERKSQGYTTNWDEVLIARA